MNTDKFIAILILLVCLAITVAMAWNIQNEENHKYQLVKDCRNDVKCIELITGPTIIRNDIKGGY